MTQNQKFHIRIIKQTIKFISIRPDRKILQLKIRHTPITVICAICNPAQNAREVNVHISPHLKRIFSCYYPQFDKLSNPHFPIEKKRRRCLQRVGLLLIIPALLNTVLKSIDSKFISRIF